MITVLIISIASSNFVTATVILRTTFKQTDTAYVTLYHQLNAVQNVILLHKFTLIFILKSPADQIHINIRNIFSFQ